MKLLKLIPLILAAAIISGCGNTAADDTDEIRREPWPGKIEGAEPYIPDDDEKQYPLRDKFEFHPDIFSDGTPLEHIKEMPRDEICEFVVCTKSESYSANESEEAATLDAELRKATELFESIGDRQSEEAMEAQKKVKAAVKALIDYRNRAEINLNIDLAERFIKSGCEAEVMAERYINLGNETVNCAVFVRTTPGNMLAIIKGMEGLEGIDLLNEVYEMRYDETVW